MARIATIACASFALILPMATSASELAPLQAGTFALKDHTASVYYTVQSKSFEVVTTIAHAEGDGAPARFTAQLMPGQTATVAVGGFGTSAPPAVLKLVHQDGVLHTEILPERVAAN